MDQYFESEGLRIHYREEGRGEPVVLVHGFSVDMKEQWIDSGVWAALSPHFRLIGFDHRGHGKSQAVHGREKYGPSYVRDLKNLLAHLRLSRAHIVGYSMGSAVTAQALVTAPEIFLSAVLAGSPGRWEWTAEDEALNIQEAAEIRCGTMTSHIRRLWPDSLPAPSDAETVRLSALALAGKDLHGLADARLSTADQVIDVHDLAATKVPVLGLIGTDDYFYPKMLRLKQLMPSLRLAEVVGASHANAPATREFQNALKKFLLENA